MTIQVLVGAELFSFSDMQDWINRAQILFRNHGHTSESTICVDRNGLICSRGKQFGEATYPVRVYAIDDPPFRPGGFRGERQPNEARCESPATTATADGGQG